MGATKLTGPIANALYKPILASVNSAPEIPECQIAGPVRSCQFPKYRHTGARIMAPNVRTVKMAENIPVFWLM